MPEYSNNIKPSMFAHLRQAAVELAKGQVVAIPTETVYGLAAVIDDENALHSIFTLKQRPFFDPLIVHVDGITQARNLVSRWPKIADCLAQAFWPGPLTIVCNKNASVSNLITASHETVAIRCPAHPFARRIIRQLGKPLAAPSANMFGKVSPTQAAHVREEFPHSNFLIIDGGPCQYGIESTVLGIEGEQVVIYRPGIIGKAEIQQALKVSGIETSIRVQAKNISPGHVPHHYQPSTPLVIISEEMLPLREETIQQICKRLTLKNSTHCHLNIPAEPTLAARLLYSELRRCDKLQVDFILVAKQKNMHGDTWDAIWDRIQRAASYHLN